MLELLFFRGFPSNVNRLFRAACHWLVGLLLLGLATPAEASVQFYLRNPGNAEVPDGVPFSLEVRVRTDIPLTAVQFMVGATGEAGVLLTGRSVDPVAPHGLVYLSELSQYPYQDGLPREITLPGATPEVLLNMQAFPYDTIGPATDILLETLEFTPSDLGELRLWLGDAQAATTLWIRDGTMVRGIETPLAPITITVIEGIPGDLDADGDVDPWDLILLIHCLKGGVGVPGEVYTRADLDENGDIDCDDLFLFHSHYGFNMPGKATGGAKMPSLDTAPSIEFAPHQTLTSWANEPLGKSLVDSTVNADVDGNWGVDHRDLTYVRARLGGDPSLGKDYQNADVNGDGAIDLADLIAVRNRMISRGHPYLGVKINEIGINPASGEPFWIELVNRGDIRLNLGMNNDRIENATGVVYTFESVLVSPGTYLQVVFDGDFPRENFGPSPYTRIRLHAQPVGEPFNRLEDFCSLVCFDGHSGGYIETDRVTWGRTLEHRNILNVAQSPIPQDGSAGRDPYESDFWVRHASASPLLANAMAAPEPIIPSFEGLVYSATTTPFVWRDRRDALLAYRVQVAQEGAFDTLLIDQIVAGTSLDASPALVPGAYTWRVRAEGGEFVSPWSATADFEVEPMPPELFSSKAALADEGGGIRQTGTTFMIDNFKRSGFVPYPAKDSRMVCLECRQDTGDHAWDSPHRAKIQPCEHDLGYTAHASIASIVKHFGGNILQDQIAYYIFGSQSSSPAPEGELGHGQGGLTPGQMKAALSWALGGPDTLSELTLTNPAETTATWDLVKGYLDNGVPPLLTQLYTHFLGGAVNLRFGQPVVGYQEIEQQGQTRCILLTQNPGLRSNFQLDPIEWKEIVSAGLLIPDPSKISLQSTDPNTWNEDTDSDGLIDVDEELRFETSVTNADTDGDGIDDKTEVWSYVFGRGMVPRKADMDGDGLRAEKDPDSDNDHCEDGEEDMNANGSFVLVPSFKIPLTNRYLGRIKEKGESDPFWEDEYWLYAEAEVEELGFNRTTGIDIEVVDVDGDPVTEQEVQVEVVPTSIGTVDDREPMTDEYGKASVQFHADHEEGVAEIRVMLDPCRFSTTEPKWEENVFIDICPMDWIFVVQEEGRMTGQEELTPFNVEVYHFPFSPSSGRVSAEQDRTQWGTQQIIHGGFYHPEYNDPGKYIDSIRLLDGDMENTTLLIDGTPAPDLHWVRSSTEESPGTWEIRLESPDVYTDWPFARYLFVRLASGRTIRAPLVWWLSANSVAQAVRDFVPAEPEDTYSVKSYENEIVRASFFFGDSDADGQDELWWLWPEQVHTGVSFIPTDTVTGAGLTFPVPYFENEGWWDPLHWDEQSWGTAWQYDVFYWYKQDYYVTPPFPWQVTLVGLASGGSIENFLSEEVSALNPLTVPDLVKEIHFKRDYIGGELIDLQNRGLTPPEYTIRMYSE